MKLRFFDVCVLGRGIGGLVAALMLQRQNAKVVVLDERLKCGSDPALGEFLNGFALKPILKRAGFHPTEVNAIPPLDVPLQLLFSDRRVDCYGDEARFQRELRREFPEASEPISRFFRDTYGHIDVFQHLLNARVFFPPKGILARRRFMKSLEQICDPSLLSDRLLAEELDAYKVGADFGRAVTAMQLALSDLVTPWTSTARLGHLLTLVRWEGYAAPQGMVTIRNLLLDKLKERGGAVGEYDEIRSVHTQGGKIVGLEVAGAEWEEIACDAVVVAGDPNGLILAAEGRRFRDWAKSLAVLPEHSRKIHQVLRVAAGGIPVGLQAQGLIVPSGPPRGTVERRACIRAIRYVVRALENSPQEGECNLAISSLVPSGISATPETLALESRSRLLEIMPFLDRYLLEEPSAPSIPPEGGRAGCFQQNSVYSCQTPRLLGILGVSPETPFRNTYYAGDAVFPGLGLDGEIIAGLQASNHASQYLRKAPKLA